MDDATSRCYKFFAWTLPTFSKNMQTHQLAAWRGNCDHDPSHRRDVMMRMQHEIAAPAHWHPCILTYLKRPKQGRRATPNNDYLLFIREATERWCRDEYGKRRAQKKSQKGAFQPNGVANACEFRHGRHWTRYSEHGLQSFMTSPTLFGKTFHCLSCFGFGIAEL